jgi:ATP/maltotriose-dependent transcriptional regulator MalT/DNA-binding SARP family transcriptional activator
MKHMKLVVKTQLIPPEPKKNLLKRDRLLTILEKNLNKRLILLTAGAGYGKTTLLAQFAQKLNGSVVFYSIKGTDTTFDTFLAYLITGIEQLYDPFGTRTRSVLETETGGTQDVERILGTFVNELLEVVDRELFIILEDYHLIAETNMINQALDYLLSQMPSNIHLVISSRTEPPLSTARLRAKDELLELTASDLRFTYKETQTLFRAIYELDIPDRLVKEMDSSFQGWVTGFQLASHLLRKHPGRIVDGLEQRKESFDYFAAEVFDEQPPDIRSFLQESCILEQMTAASCDAVLLRDNSSRILDDLLRRNLFITVADGAERTFQYHQLFRAFLSDRLSETVGDKRVSSLHLRAAKYFRDTGRDSIAFYHYLTAKEIQKAVHLLEAKGRDLIEAVRFDTLEQWVEKLPHDVVQGNSVLLWYQAEVFLWQGRRDEAMKAYDRARAKLARQGKKNELANVIYGIAVLSIRDGAYRKAIRLGTQALEMLGTGQPSLKARLLRVTGSAYSQLGDYTRGIATESKALKICRRIGDRRQERAVTQHLLSTYAGLGEYDRVIEESERAIKRESDGSESNLTWAWVNLARAYAVKGEYQRARTGFLQALRLSRRFSERKAGIATLRLLGLLNLMMGDCKLARSYCERALRFSIDLGDYAAKLFALHGISQSYLYEKNLTRAEECINKIVPEDQTHVPVGERFILITKGQIETELGDYLQAKTTLNLALRSILKSRSGFDLMLADVALADLYYRMEEPETGRCSPAARKHLKRALQFSRRNGYHHALIRLGEMNVELLQFAVRNGVEPRYSTFLLEKFPSQHDLMIRFFGGLSIKNRDHETIAEKWRTQKARSLFCYLIANRNRAFVPDQLIELLWPDQSFSRTRSKLWRTVSLIRVAIGPPERTTGPLIQYRDGCYTVNPKCKIWIDFEEFDRLRSEAYRHEERRDVRKAISKYESAISLYSGDFLAQIYDNWSEEKRLLYRKRYLDVLHKLAGLYLREREFDNAIRCSNQIIAQDQLRESAYLIAIQSHISSGNRKAAVDLYKRLQKTLRNELGVEPSAEANSLVHGLIKKS